MDSKLTDATTRLDITDSLFIRAKIKLDQADASLKTKIQQSGQQSGQQSRQYEIDEAHRQFEDAQRQLEEARRQLEEARIQFSQIKQEQEQANIRSEEARRNFEQYGQYDQNSFFKLAFQPLLPTDQRPVNRLPVQPPTNPQPVYRPAVQPLLPTSATTTSATAATTSVTAASTSATAASTSVSAEASLVDQVADEQTQFLLRVTQQEYEAIKATFTPYYIIDPPLIKEYIEDLPTREEALLKVLKDEKDKQYFKDEYENILKAQYKSNDAKYAIIKVDEMIIKVDEAKNKADEVKNKANEDKALAMAKAYSAIANAKDASIKAIASLKSIGAIILPLIKVKEKEYIEDPIAFNKFKIVQNSKENMEFIKKSTKNAEIYNEVIEEEKKKRRLQIYNYRSK